MEDTPNNPTNEQSPNIVTEGQVWRSVWLLSWPSIISMFLQTAYGYINLYFVGHLGKASVAAVGIANSVLFVQFAALSGVSVGTSALVARFTGAQNMEEANDATRQSIILTVVLTMLTAIAGILLAPFIFHLLGAKADVLPIAILYLNISLLGGVPVFVLNTVTSAFRAIGDMRTPLYVMVVATVLNVLFDWLLVRGIGPFPRMGAPGTAVSVVISRVVSLVIAYYYLSKSSLANSMKRWWEVHAGWFERILRIGIPAALQGLLRSGNSIIYYWIFGLTASATMNAAALTVGLRAESLAFMPGFAFAMAATALVGQNLGARQPKRASKAAWIATGQGVAVMSLMGLLFFIFAEPFARFFITDPKVIPLIVSYLRINALSEPFLAIAMILTGALQGAGETRWPTIITFLSLYVIRLPLTYWLMVNLKFDVSSAWWLMATSTVIGGIMTALVFFNGKWQETEV